MKVNSSKTRPSLPSSPRLCSRRVPGPTNGHPPAPALPPAPEAVPPRRPAEGRPCPGPREGSTCQPASALLAVAPPPLQHEVLVGALLHPQLEGIFQQHLLGLQPHRGGRPHSPLPPPLPPIPAAAPTHTAPLPGAAAGRGEQAGAVPAPGHAGKCRSRGPPAARRRRLRTTAPGGPCAAARRPGRARQPEWTSDDSGARPGRGFWLLLCHRLGERARTRHLPCAASASVLSGRAAAGSELPDGPPAPVSLNTPMRWAGCCSALWANGRSPVLKAGQMSPHVPPRRQSGVTRDLLSFYGCFPVSTKPRLQQVTGAQRKNQEKPATREGAMAIISPTTAPQSQRPCKSPPGFLPRRDQSSGPARCKCRLLGDGCLFTFEVMKDKLPHCFRHPTPFSTNLEGRFWLP